MRIVGEMTIYTATELWKQVTKALNKRTGTLSLDLSAVTEFDTAGLQLVLMAQRLASAAGRELQIVQPSPAVSEVFGLLQLQAAVGAPAQGHA
jgi:anti-sigma B factor antagonist